MFEKFKAKRLRRKIEKKRKDLERINSDIEHLEEIHAKERELDLKYLVYERTILKNEIRQLESEVTK